VFYVDDAPKILIRPNPYNQHVTFHNFMKRVREIPGERGDANLFFVEDVAYQKAAIQENGKGDASRGFDEAHDGQAQPVAGSSAVYQEWDGAIPSERVRATLGAGFQFGGGGAR